MAMPYSPIVLATPVTNPAAGSVGIPPIAYISNAMYVFAPTAVDAKHLVPGSKDDAAQAQALADTLLRASQWADRICFGVDPAGKGNSIAASLSVQAVQTRIKRGRGSGPELRLLCDYKPVLQAIGIDVGLSPAQVSSIGPTLAAMARIERRTIKVPWGWGPIQGRPSDSGPVVSYGGGGGVYAVWSYVSGYPHTSLVSSVAADATECTVVATNGSGGMWGIFSAVPPFPGTNLTIYDGNVTETVFIQDVTPGSNTTVLTTTPFLYDHVVPAAPDFLPVTTIPADVHEAIISLTSMLIKTRGAKALVMPSSPGGTVPTGTKKAMAQAGALSDYNRACMLLHPFGVRSKQAV